jgi:hypothetical protein
VIAEIRRSPVLDEAALRSMVEVHLHGTASRPRRARPTRTG